MKVSPSKQRAQEAWDLEQDSVTRMILKKLNLNTTYDITKYYTEKYAVLRILKKHLIPSSSFSLLFMI